MKLSLSLAVGLLLAASPGASADTIGAAAPPVLAEGGALDGRIVNKARSCGPAYKGDARFDFRRSIDGMGAGTVKVRRGKKAAANLEPGTYDVRVYLYQRRAYRYITTRHLVVTGERWEAAFGCAPGSKEPGLKLTALPPRVARRR